MNTARKLAFYSPEVMDKFVESKVYVGEVALFSMPSTEHDYGTGITLSGVIDGQEVVGKLERSLYRTDISFRCPKTDAELFFGDITVSSDEMLLILGERSVAHGRKFSANSVPGVDPALKQWGEKQSRIHEIRDSFLSTNEFEMRNLFG